MQRLEPAFCSRTPPAVPFPQASLSPGASCGLALARAVGPLALPPLAGPGAGAGGKEALRGGGPPESAAGGVCWGGGEGQGGPGAGRAGAARLRGEEEEPPVSCGCREALGAGGATAAGCLLLWLARERRGVPVPRGHSSGVTSCHKPIFLGAWASFCRPCRGAGRVRARQSQLPSPGFPQGTLCWCCGEPCPRSRPRPSAWCCSVANRSRRSAGDVTCTWARRSS